MSKLTLKLPIPPPANIYWRYDRGSVHVSAIAHKYRYDVGLLTGNLTPLTGKLFLVVRVFPVDRRRDADSFVKVLFDALQGTVYVNDKQIKRFYVDVREPDKLNPRIEIDVRPIIDRGEKKR